MKKKKPKPDKENKDKEKKIPSRTNENQANGMSAKSTAWDDRFDLGGLPHRDLKKNLGCG